MTPKFTIGDVVQLKSGGPKMTVSSTKNYGLINGEEYPFEGEIHCTWFEKNKPTHGTFQQDMLEKVEH